MVEFNEKQRKKKPCGARTAAPLPRPLHPEGTLTFQHSKRPAPAGVCEREWIVYGVLQLFLGNHFDFSARKELEDIDAVSL